MSLKLAHPAPSLTHEQSSLSKSRWQPRPSLLETSASSKPMPSWLGQRAWSPLSGTPLS
jgi:hypothetical protein